LVTNNYYIGSAQDLYRRFYLHTNGYSSNIILQNAIKKYGLQNFVFSIYAAVPTDSDLLDKLELEQLESKIISSGAPPAAALHPRPPAGTL
jgi:group I intron endonuclease